MCALYLPFLHHLFGKQNRSHTHHLSILIYCLLFIHHLQSSDREENTTYPIGKRNRGRERTARDFLDSVQRRHWETWPEQGWAGHVFSLSRCNSSGTDLAIYHWKIYSWRRERERETTTSMSSRIKSAFKLGDSKKNNEVEINESLKKEDFCLSEVRIHLYDLRFGDRCVLDRSIRLSLSTDHTRLRSRAKGSRHRNQTWHHQNVSEDVRSRRSLTRTLLIVTVVHSSNAHCNIRPKWRSFNWCSVSMR